MTKTKLTLLLMTLALLAACGSGGGNKLQMTINGNNADVDVRSSGVYPSTKTFSFTADGQTTSTKAVSHYIALANFEMDTKGPITMGAALKNDGEMRVIFQTVGAEGTDEKTLPKTGTFNTKCEKFDCVDYLNISRFTGGKEEKVSIDTRKAEGYVRINSVTDDTVSGEIDVKEGANAVKGSFTAKITTKR